MAEINSTRRFYLLKRLFQRTVCGEEGVWQSLQEAIPGTALPDAFPARSTLVTAGYSTIEDLDGADVTELRSEGLTGRQAQQALAALAPLI